MKKTLRLASVIYLLCASLLSYSQSNIWKPSDFRDGTNNVSLSNLNKEHYQVFQLNIENLKSQLQNAPHRNSTNGVSNTIVQFPNTKGELESYRVVETAIFSSEEGADMFPNMKTYLGSDVNGNGSRIRFSITHLGLKAMISEPNRDMYFIQPVTKVSNGQYLIYNRKVNTDIDTDFECLTDDLEVYRRTAPSYVSRDANDQVLRTYRIAISTTSEYTGFWDDGNPSNGSDQVDALAELISTLNRSNEVFEVDMAISFLLVNTVDDPALDIIYSGTDPYGFDLNGDLQANLTATVGEADYDIGHLFDFGANSGNAGCIGCVCENGKGSGWSSHSFLDNDGGPYQADFFDIDYVPHEIGHQMGANHTFSFRSEGTGVNAEPGSGTTIMGYAGITGIDDVQDHSDPYFHIFSIAQILNNVETAPNNCSIDTPISNNPPVADAGLDFTIPSGTAFVLRGNATDPDGSDVLTYCWEQIDNGVTTNGNFGPTKATGAVWRSRPPGTSPDRYMPFLDRVLNDQLTESNPVETIDNSSWETVSTVQRDLNFGLTVRDRSEAGGTGQTPQTSFDTMTVTVDGTSGPFRVTSQATNVTWDAGSTQTVTWDVAGTNTGNVNTPTVNILLSVDGGQTFPFTLASAVPNDGSEDIVVPLTGGDTTTARVIVEGNNNIFFAVNATEFTIQESEFVISLNTSTLDICQPDNAVYNFTYNTFLGFSGTTTFSVNGLPAGVSAIIDPISATADNTTGAITITGTNNFPLGNNTFTFEGDSGSTFQSENLELNVFNATITSPNLTGPANGAVDLSSQPLLQWDADDNVQDYFVEVATDASFNTIIDSATIQTTSYIPNNLNPSTTYFWRVTASNLCGTSPASTVFTFTTSAISCNSSSAMDLPIDIINTANGTDNYTSVISVTENAPVTDVNVTIDIEHAWNNDLDIFLISPAGTIVELSTDNGADDDDDYTNTIFDQEASTPITSGTSPFTGTFIPEGDLSVLYGEFSAGDWTLSVDDDFSFVDGGTILNFTLELCIEGTLSVVDQQIEVGNVLVFPNPNKGSFNVKLPNSLSADAIDIEVFDIRGRRVFEKIYDYNFEFNQSINLNNVQSGMYLVRIDDGTRTVTKRVIIE